MDARGLHRLGLRPDPGGVLTPEVAADRCVHSHLEQATCRACVDACPRGAVVLDDERLGIDTSRCDACGLCTPACPQGAVLPAFAPATYPDGAQSIAFAACTQAPVPIGEVGVLPCLHALGLRDLLALRRAGVTRLVLSRGDCGVCPRGSATPIDTWLDAAGQILEGRGLAPLVAVWLASEAWRRARAAARQPKPGIDRRTFFREAIGSAVEQVVRRAEGDAVVCGAQRVFPPGRYFPATAAGQVVPFAPDIDAGLCTGCDACARLCPEEAIRVEPNAYRLDPDGCTGCGVCVDLCTQGAVTVRPMAVPARMEVPLYPGRCRACGAPFHRPRPMGIGPLLCPLCAVAGHHRRLFQVLVGASKGFVPHMHANRRSEA